MFFDGHYTAWRQKRYNFIIKLLGQDYFKDKTLLELGAGCGHFGKMFYDLGSKVTCVEARSINVDRGQKIHPQLKWLEHDLENFLPQSYRSDIVLDTGLFYHLINIDKHLLNASLMLKPNGIWILEGEVANNHDPFFFVQTQEDTKGIDSSWSGFGIRPSASYIERVLKNLNIHFIRYDVEDLNCDCHNYTWTVTNQSDREHGWWANGLRRFWICTKPTEPYEWRFYR